MWKKGGQTMTRMATVYCIIVCTGAFALGQNPQKRNRFVLEPSEQVLLVTASQPDSPIAIENAQRFLDVDNNSNVRHTYQLRNKSSKPIRSVSVVEWTSFGTGGTLVPQWSVADGLLMPGQTASSDGRMSEVEIVPLTQQLRDKLLIKGPLKAIIVLMIETVEYADGSRYDATVHSKAVSLYFQRLDDIISRAP
jgi:hypothetical protein